MKGNISCVLTDELSSPPTPFIQLITQWHALCYVKSVIFLELNILLTIQLPTKSVPCPELNILLTIQLPTKSVPCPQLNILLTIQLLTKSVPVLEIKIHNRAHHSPHQFNAEPQTAYKFSGRFHCDLHRSDLKLMIRH